MAEGKSVKIPLDLYEQIRECAAVEDRQIGTIIRRAFAAYLERKAT